MGGVTVKTESSVAAGGKVQRSSPKINRRKRNLHWESLIAASEAGDYLVVPLCSSNALREEGEAMNHCVGQRYHRWCHVGAVRIFSIRDLLGRRIATLSIYFDFSAMRWRFEQCKGFGNQTVYWEPGITGDEVSPTDKLGVYFVVQHLIALYQSAQESDGQGSLKADC